MWPWFDSPYRRVGDAPLRNASGVAIFVGDFRVMSFTSEQNLSLIGPSELLEHPNSSRNYTGMPVAHRFGERRSLLHCVVRQLMTPAFAEMIRTPHSRISFFMNKFRKLGYRSRVHVRSAHLNVLLHD